MKRKTLLIAVLIAGFLGCNTQSTRFIYENDQLKVERLTEHTYRHISYLETEDFGKVGCNGMIVIRNKEALIFDTPTTTGVSAQLIEWVENQMDCKVTGIIATHYHADCLGGLEAFHQREIPSYASFRTIAKARAAKASVPEKGFKDRLTLKVGDKEVVNIFYGEGHTTDNIISYFPEDHVLFGGCLIKALGAGKGYLGDANPGEWSNTVKAVRAGIKDARVIIPGHGYAGNTALLDYTIQLFEVD